MIRFQPITTANIQHYKFMEELLVESFPPDEYRQLDHLREFTDRKGNFYNNVIFEDELPIGFITYWDFDHFFYIEHFTTNPALRNGGYGKMILEYICQNLKKPIVLEVERPDTSDDEMAERRINFYRRNGFVMWNNDYIQPPYKPEDNPIPMYLMVHGDVDQERDYEMVRDTIYSEVYGVK